MYLQYIFPARRVPVVHPAIASAQNRPLRRRPILALDGCPLHCVAHILKRHGLKPDRHYDLSQMGVPKKPHEDFDPQQAAAILQRLLEELKVPLSHASAAAASDPSPAAPEEEWPEPSSPVCYAREFKHWESTASDETR
jgi:hypothetical protein